MKTATRSYGKPNVTKVPETRVSWPKEPGNTRIGKGAGKAVAENKVVASDGGAVLGFPV